MLAYSARDLWAYLLPVQTSLIRFQDYEPLAADVEAGALDLLDAVFVTFVGVCGYDLFHLLRCDVEA